MGNSLFMKTDLIASELMNESKASKVSGEGVEVLGATLEDFSRRRKVFYA